MIKRYVLLACFLTVLALSAWAQETAPAEPVRGFTPERLAASSSALVALIGTILGGVAVARSRPSTLALAAGAIGILVGAFLLLTADAGPGSGNGVIGAAVAVVLGLISATLGGLARARASRAAA